MDAYTVHLEQVPGLLDAWSASREVLAPRRLGKGLYDFGPWQPGRKDSRTPGDVAWEYDLAYNSLKRHFLPPKEELFRFELGKGAQPPSFEAPPKLLFGVHPYDVKAINQLDQLMEEGSPDAYYLKRREATVIMAMEPMRVAAEAFWSSMGSAEVNHGYDLYWTKIGPSSFFVEVGSSLGEELLMAGGPLEKATVSQKEAARRAHVRLMGEAAHRKLNHDWRETPKVLEHSWNHPLWQHKARLCFSCGSCVMVCPTCYCFDVSEEVDVSLKTGARHRQWGGCMLTNFSTVAGGHNFRPSPRERYRHRYFRKGKYIFDKIGEPGCVGCGRCVRACTSKIADPMSVFNELKESMEHEA